MKQNLNKSLDSIYKFMAEAYEGNWSYRWGGVPWMEINTNSGKNESILAHEWACVGFWMTIRDVCPALAKLVSAEEVYERLWIHDLGETFIGDISQFRQINGEGVNKHLLEKQEIERMTKILSPKTAKKLQKYSEEFESPIEKINKLDALVAKLIDGLQGNHFALVFAEGLGSPANKVSVKKIVERTTVRNGRQLLKVLKKKGHLKAHKEVLSLINHHIDFYKKLGIDIEF
jgi:5'-deoxynucleotidase YfbR-like HD superfamily hydrolase